MFLAQHGWETVGIDAVEQPLRKARARAAATGVDVQWIKADVAGLGELGLEPGFTLLHDRGCFHGLSESARVAYIRGVSSLAAPGARLVMMAFERNRKLGGPSGADRDEIAASFGQDWEIGSAEVDSGPGPPGPMRNVARYWYRLVRLN